MSTEILSSFFIPIKTYGLEVLKFYTQMIGVHIIYVPIYHAPYNENLFLRSNLKKNFITEQIFNIVINNNQTPPIFSKIFLYHFFNNLYPKGRIPYYYYKYLPQLKPQYIQSLIEFQQSKIIYDDLLYYSPPTTLTGRMMNTICLPIVFFQALGLWHLFAFNLNKFFYKYFPHKGRILNNTAFDFFTNYSIKKNFFFSSQLLKDGYDPQYIKALNILNLNLESESRNFINFIHQFIKEINNIIKNMTVSIAVNKFTEIILSQFPKFFKSNRKNMFNDLPKSKSLRYQAFHKDNEKKFFAYLNKINNNHKYFQHLQQLKKQAKNKKEKTRILQKLSKYTSLPRLIIIGPEAEQSCIFLINEINKICKIYIANFDCLSVKRNLIALAGSPDFQKNSFLMHLFKLIKNNHKLKHLFDETINKKYRFDLLIFNDVQVLLNNRFGKFNLNFKDFLATTMFLEHLFEPKNHASFIFTISELRKDEIDLGLLKFLDVFINLQLNHQEEIKRIFNKLMVQLFINENFIAINTITYEDLKKWIIQTYMENDDIDLFSLFILIEQSVKICHSQQLSFNLSILNQIFNHFHQIKSI